LSPTAGDHLRRAAAAIEVFPEGSDESASAGMMEVRGFLGGFSAEVAAVARQARRDQRVE
jgi:hypothetical protein